MLGRRKFFDPDGGDAQPGNEKFRKRRIDLYFSVQAAYVFPGNRTILYELDRLISLS